MSDPRDFRAEIIQSENELVVRIAGEIDIGCFQEFRKLLLLAAEQTPAIIVDLSNTTFIDSSALSALIVVQGQLRRNNGGLVLRSPREQARMVLEVSGLSGMLPIEEADPN